VHHEIRSVARSVARSALHCAAVIALTITATAPLSSQSAPAAAALANATPTAANLAARTWYQDAKLGMFIHWGPSSVLQDGEWVMNNRGIRADEYESLLPLFNPVKFNAALWVRTAKAAGMKYITLITKHHDGIALFDSKVSDYTVVKRSPFARDVLRELADACARDSIRLFLYYSQLDWHHPDFYPRGQTGLTAGRPASGSFARYLDYMDAQLTELLTNYGPIGGIWFDGVWDQPKTDWRLAQTYALIHRLQPATLIIPNNHETPRPGEDVQTFERDLPGANGQGFNTTTIGALPLEMSETMNDSWGFRLTDRNWKTPTTLIRSMVEAAGRNTNFLLNVGPRPDGTFPDSALARLSALGAWLDVNGTSIYGTRGGPLSPRPWGVTTQKGDTVFVHVLHGQDAVIAMPAFPRRVQRAFLLNGGASVGVSASASSLTLTLAQRTPEAPDQVVALVLAH
jgi:alpha-L-fucosidase